ncbi:hypothetical protein ACFFHH_00120 [Cytobacillus solani]|nr:hypothetical protein [Cytobacillus solani]USK56000.1 hypothetical protein LIS82_05690 [Cytobacillus solani]
MNFLLAIMKSFLHLGGIKIAMILCLAAGIVYLVKQRKKGKNSYSIQ